MKKILLLLFSFFILALIVISQRNNRYIFQGKASVEDDAVYCVNPPECCAKMDETHSAYECEWPIRGYCKNCGAIEGRQERCGWYWIFHSGYTDSPTGYGCMIGSENNMRPKYGVSAITDSPTSTPIPTVKPTIQPTAEPTIQPEEIQPPEPTTAIRVPPNETAHPIITNSFQNSKPTSVIQRFEFPSIQFPKISLPNISINLVKINQNARKPFGFFEYLFRRIIYYDGLLENRINSKINDIIK